MSAIMSQSNGDVLVVYFTEAKLLDDRQLQEIATELTRLAGKAEDGKLLLNFQGVRFMASAMLGKLVQLNKKCKQEEVSLKFCNIDPEIMKVFTLMKLNKLLDIYPDESKALIAFKKRGWFGK